MKDKILWIDVARVLCALMIVVLHAASISYSFYATGDDECYKSFLEPTWVFCRAAVPIFVMISGFLLLNPERDYDYKTVLTKYVWRMLAVLLTIGTFYAWLEIVFEEKQLSWNQFPISLYKVCRGDLWDHMWYLYMLIGLYLILPIINSFVQKADNKQIDVCLIIIGFFSIVQPDMSVLGLDKTGIMFPISSAYVFYFLFGYRIKASKTTFWHIPLLGCLFLLLIIVLLEMIWPNRLYDSQLLGYHSILIAVLSGFMFLLLRTLLGRTDYVMPVGGVNLLARLSFGIYIFHPLYYNVFFKLFHISPLKFGLPSLSFPPFRSGLNI